MAKSTKAFFAVTLILTLILLTVAGCRQAQKETGGKEKLLQKKLDAANKKIKQLKKQNNALKNNSEDEEAINPDTKATREFAYIKKIYAKAGKNFMEVDFAQMLSGPAADAAAQADGVIAAGEHVENDYYIKNVNTKLRTFEVATAKSVTETYNMSSAGQVAKKTIPFTEFKTIFQTEPENQMNMVANPYWLTISGNKIIKIEEQYLP